MAELVTATGVLALLADEEVELKVFALQTLNEDIDTVWFEVAPAVTDMYVVARYPLLSDLHFEFKLECKSTFKSGYAYNTTWLTPLPSLPP